MFYKEVFSCLFLSLVVVMVIVIEEGFIKCLIVLVSMIEDLVVVVYFFKLCVYRLIFFEFLLELLLKELFWMVYYGWIFCYLGKNWVYISLCVSERLDIVVVWGSVVIKKIRNR